MISLRSRLNARSLGASLAAIAAAVSLVGCAETDGPVDAAPDMTESQRTTTTTTSQAPTSTTPSRSLAASFARLKLPDDVGVAIAPVGGGPAIVLGDQTARVAWSTIKIPLALAAQRKNGPSPLTETAIVDSDNDAALQLRLSLGTPGEARTAVSEVLRSGNDTATEVVRIKQADETFGLTPWPLANAATFTAALPCLADTTSILGFMGTTASNQEWGLKVMTKPKATAVKGGWGPGDQGGVEVRQIGLITFPGGAQTAVAMSSYPEGAEMGTGVANLNRVARWLDRSLTRLPRGTCA